MFEDFSYRNYHVRAGVRQRGVDGHGKWYGVISMVCESEECLLSLPDHVFDWPAAARRHAIGYARALIDSRLDGASRDPEAMSPSQASVDITAASAAI
jgi:hypothetical protein